MSFIKIQRALKEEQEQQASASSTAIGMEELGPSLSLGILCSVFFRAELFCPGKCRVSCDQAVGSG